MNKVILMGRTTKDPEIRYNDANTCIARYTLAVDRRYKKDDESQTADFISIISFAKTAEFLEKYARKGVKLVVEGRIETGSYTNSDGQKVYTQNVIGEHVEFAESKKASCAAGQPTSDSGDGFMNIPDGIEEELPFN